MQKLEFSGYRAPDYFTTPLSKTCFPERLYLIVRPAHNARDSDSPIRRIFQHRCSNDWKENTNTIKAGLPSAQLRLPFLHYKQGRWRLQMDYLAPLFCCEERIRLYWLLINTTSTRGIREVQAFAKKRSKTALYH